MLRGTTQCPSRLMKKSCEPSKSTLVSLAQTQNLEATCIHCDPGDLHRIEVVCGCVAENGGWGLLYVDRSRPAFVYRQGVGGGGEANNGTNRWALLS